MECANTDPCIVYLAGTDVSRDNGAGINERGFVSAVANEPDMLCVLPRPEYPENYSDPRHVCVYGHRGTWWRFPLFLASLLKTSVRIERRRSITGIVVRPGVPAILGFLLARLWRIPLFLKTHSSRQAYAGCSWKILFSRDNSMRQMRRARLLDAVWRPFNQMILRSAAVVDCPSPTCRDVVQSELTRSDVRVVAIPNGADITAYRIHDGESVRSRFNWPEDAFVVGYAGAMGGEVRFVGELVSALVRLAARHPIYALLLGNGPQHSALCDQVSAAGLTDRIRLPGYVPNREIAEWISAMNLAADMTAVAFALNGGTVYASYSQKIAQYLACGVPVLAWDLPDTQFLEENQIGFLAPFGEAQGLEKTLETALRTADRDALRARCRQYATGHLSHQALAAVRLDFWRSVITSNRVSEQLS